MKDIEFVSVRTVPSHDTQIEPWKREDIRGRAIWDTIEINVIDNTDHYNIFKQFEDIIHTQFQIEDQEQQESHVFWVGELGPFVHFFANPGTGGNLRGTIQNPKTHVLTAVEGGWNSGVGYYNKFKPEEEHLIEVKLIIQGDFGDGIKTFMKVKSFLQMTKYMSLDIEMVKIDPFLKMECMYWPISRTFCSKDRAFQQVVPETELDDEIRLQYSDDEEYEKGLHSTSW